MDVGRIKTPNLSKGRDGTLRVLYKRKAELPIDFVKSHDRQLGFFCLKSRFATDAKLSCFNNVKKKITITTHSGEHHEKYSTKSAQVKHTT